MEHRLSALLQLHLHSRLNIWLQWTWQINYERANTFHYCILILISSLCVTNKFKGTIKEGEGLLAIDQNTVKNMSCAFFIALPWQSQQARSKTGCMGCMFIIDIYLRCILLLLSGVPDYFGRNKILSGYDLSHYQVPHCIKSFLLFCLICVYSSQFSILFWIMYLL